MSDLSRRTLLRAAAAAAAAPAVMNPIAAAAAAPKTARRLEQVLAMSPVDMARESQVVQSAFRMLQTSASRLPEGSVKRAVLDILKNPAPTFAADRADVLAKLKAAGYVAEDRVDALPPSGPVQPFWSAPGSGYASHHAYPGGLVTHTALNVASAEALLAQYREVYGAELDPEHAVGGELLHDLHKPWVFGWLADGSCRKEQPLAGTGEHHVLSIAESMKRGLPNELVIAQACAHNHPGSPAGAREVAAWLDAAGIIAGVDPVAKGILRKDKTLAEPLRMEGFVVHLADHDWVLSVPACQACANALYALGREVYGLKDAKALNALRNYAMAELTAMRLYAVLSTGGREAFRREVERVVAKA